MKQQNFIDEAADSQTFSHLELRNPDAAYLKSRTILQPFNIFMAQDDLDYDLNLKKVRSNGDLNDYIMHDL